MFAFCAGSGPLPAPFGQACVLPGVWSMVGAAATLAGVTRTTVSLAVIMFELTGTLTYVTPVMVAVLFAKTVADYVEERSIYDLVIECVTAYRDFRAPYLLTLYVWCPDSLLFPTSIPRQSTSSKATH